MLKRMSVMVSVVLVVLMVVGAAAAQDARRPRHQGRGNDGLLSQLVSIITTETELSVQEIRDELQSGATLADVIEANGANVEDVITQAMEILTERVNTALEEGNITEERAAEILENLEQNLNDIINGDLRLGNVRGGINLRQRVQFHVADTLLEAITDATDLSGQELLAEVRDGATIAELLETKGSNVEAIVDTAVSSITEQVEAAVADESITQEQADVILENLEERLTEALNENTLLRGFYQMRYDLRGFPNFPNIDNRAAAGIIEAVASAADLEASDVLAQVRDGATLADVLTETDVDVENFIDEQIVDYAVRLEQAVEDGRITQDVADARLNLRRVELEALLNRDFTAQQSDDQ